jgi:hypothetical protein
MSEATTRDAIKATWDQLRKAGVIDDDTSVVGISVTDRDGNRYTVEIEPAEDRPVVGFRPTGEQRVKEGG